ncbi:MAG: hypothetical protein N3C12_04965 [Candidatus Binatia bacterium]|nr:hypothetical protein [Candidatus Binatia bacterium]
MTAPTKQFLRERQSKHGIDTVLIGSYHIGVQRQPQTLATGQMIIVEIPVYTVRMHLYSVEADDLWWRAKITRMGTMQRASRVIITESLAAHIGKGRLLNL